MPGIFNKIAFLGQIQAAETGKLPDFIKLEVVWIQRQEEPSHPLKFNLFGSVKTVRLLVKTIK